ncbi:hypothetical protein J27TS7_53990 [Paenibacillus dendritiformis]|nr:hypothetical protein J27TS7_53990 [Paenibacillus dendritiformis]
MKVMKEAFRIALNGGLILLAGVSRIITSIPGAGSPKLEKKETYTFLRRLYRLIVALSLPGS